MLGSDVYNNLAHYYCDDSYDYDYDYGSDWTSPDWKGPNWYRMEMPAGTSIPTEPVGGNIKIQS